MLPERRYQRWLLRIVVDAETGCWLWQGYCYKGYAIGSTADDQPVALHRLFYERYVGPLEPGKHVHHRCGVRRCLYPNHLEQLTRREHSLQHIDQFESIRGSGQEAALRHWRDRTHCKHGHEFTPENTYIASNGGKRCRQCGNERQRAYSARKRAAALDTQARGVKNLDLWLGRS